MVRADSRENTHTMECFFCASAVPAGLARIDGFGNAIGPCCAHLFDGDV
jgi:hypothetical protein